MEKFASHIVRNGEIEIILLNNQQRFLLESTEGELFASNLLEHMQTIYPQTIIAAEEKMKIQNKTLFSIIKQNKFLYTQKIAHILCACCFGELDERPSYDGEQFYMKYPRMCRNFKYCPWNGCSEQNKNSFKVICGAKRDYGFSSQERKVVLMVQEGKIKINVIAEEMGLTNASIHKFMLKIHQKTGVDSLAELIHLIKFQKI